MSDSPARPSAVTRGLAALTTGVSQFKARGYRIARWLGRADGAALVTCGGCPRIVGRHRAIRAAGETWACSAECAETIAAEQAW
jgi:hypothetical protein